MAFVPFKKGMPAGKEPEAPAKPGDKKKPAKGAGMVAPKKK